MMQGTALPEEDRGSSYGTGESDDEAPMEIHTSSVKDAWIHTLEDMKRIVVMLDANQSTFASRLSSLEKVVMSVQEDMTCVRGDVRMVHADMATVLGDVRVMREVLENLVEAVGMLHPTVTDVEGVPHHGSPDLPAWGWPQDAAITEPSGMPEPTEGAEEDPIDLGQEEPSHIHMSLFEDSEIMETQMYEEYNGLNPIRPRRAEPGAGGSRPTTVAVDRGMGPPAGKQVRRRDENATLEYGSTQMELTLGGTETETQAHGQAMWSNFAHTMGDMRAPVSGGGDSSVAWVPQKRGRASWPPQGASNA